MARVCIGIPCYSTVSAETLEDYMRFTYNCGRRIIEHDFFLAIKSKTEQFRARNAIVTAALQAGCDYLLFLDDDHVLDWEKVQTANPRYSFIKKFVDFLANDPKAGIIGALYYHRGGDCRPVIMNEGPDGGFYWIPDHEIKNDIQDVGVTGGGCFLIKAEVFNKIESPWFRPELDLGTDLQVCKAAREAGFKVYCDTSTVIGHVMSRHEIITPRNKDTIAIQNQNHDQTIQGIEVDWLVKSALTLYREDVNEYLGITDNHLEYYTNLAESYGQNMVWNFTKYEDHKDYYRNLGNEQLARQLLYHHLEPVVQEMDAWYKIVRTNEPGYGLDYGCGSAPVTFDLALRGHKLDFIDVDGAGAYEFLKWRVKKRNIQDRCGFELNGPYDYACFLDSIEHFKNWEEILSEVISRLKKNGAILTNFFTNRDFNNPEHINMDHNAVKRFLVDKNMVPVNIYVWRKQEG
jgi:hypothetical protein